MALTDTFPTQNANGSSLDETRLVLAGDMARSTAGVARLGILPAHTNALVTGTAGMAYSVAPFNGVGSRTGVGVEKVANDAATSVSTTTAPVANSRIDVIWWRPQFVSATDAANVPLFGVTQGVAAPTPVKPSVGVGANQVPPGALELATAVVLSTTTQTSTTVITQTFLYTAMEGGTVLVRNSTELAAWTPHDGSHAYNLAEGALFRRVGGAWKGWDSGWISYTPSSSTITAGGSGTTVTRYRYVAGRVLVHVYYVFAAGGTITGAATLALPMPRSAPAHAFEPFAELGNMHDASLTTNHRLAIASDGGSTTVVRFGWGLPTTTADVTATTPIAAIAVGDVFEATFSYDPA